MSLQTFTRAYIEALYFTDGQGVDDDEFDADTPLSFPALRAIARDCGAFYKAHAETINAEGVCLYGGCSPDEYAGHDFWLTRNSHGCGFWESYDWEQSKGGAVLDRAASAFGEVWPYAGDDGRIYF